MFAGLENIAHHVSIYRATSPPTGIAVEAENGVAVPIKADSMIEKTRLDKRKKPTFRGRS
jgi:hypothetical protein